MPLRITHRSIPTDQTARSFRVLDSETNFYFDVYFIHGLFEDGHIFTAFVDPVGYDELNDDGVRINLPPAFFQALEPRVEPEWEATSMILVEGYLEYRKTGSSHWLIRSMDPVLKDPVSEPETPVQRVSRYERNPVI